MLIKVLAAIGSFWLLALQQPIPSHQELIDQADAYYAEKSFARANQAYLKIPLSSLPAKQARWVEFRRADTLWRSGTGQGAHDFSQLQQARRKLEELVERQEREMGRPGQVWAEAHLSLADMLRYRSRHTLDWNQTWPHYQKALDWWAGSQDVDTARRRYVDVALAAFSNRGAPPERFNPNHYAHNHPESIAVLEKALSIARQPRDRAAISYLLAYYLIRSDNVFDSRRASGYLEQLIPLADQIAWAEAALFEYAQWLENSGLLDYDEQGNLQRQPDPAKALQLYRRLVDGRPAGESNFYRRAKNRTEVITSSMLEVGLTNAFLPGSEVQFHLHWRNLSSLKLELFAVDLTRSITPDRIKSRHSEWNQWLDLEGRTPLQSWRHQLPQLPQYQVGRQAVTLPYRLDAGAYVLRGRSGDAQGQAILLVSRASLILLSSQEQVTAYFCDAWDGSPLADARLSLWERTWVDNVPKWIRREAATDHQGMARFEIQGRNHRSIHAFARKRGQQAYARSYSGGRKDGEQWTFHTITDRPAYRPGETAHWKAVARQSEPDGYSTPSGRGMVMVIRDPQGSEAMRQSVTLNEFGSAWGSLELTSKMPLGMYTALFYEPNQDQALTQSPLFRLEEYKLPEFRVEVEIPQQDGQPKIFRPGERIEALVKTEYYFGGPVSGAQVEVVVRQKPFRPSWRPPRSHPWLYRDNDVGTRYYNRHQPGTEVHRQSITADASGQLRFSYQPEGAPEDREYTLEARVRDSSRREVSARASIKVTRQRVFLFPQPRKAVYRPGDVAQVDLWARDANQQPVQTEGRLTVSREQMVEVWHDPQGRSFEGDDLEQNRQRLPQGPDWKGWTRQWRIERQEVLSRPFSSSKEGKAEFSFRPQKPGRYQIRWFSPDPGAMPAKAEVLVWVASDSTTELGIRSSGIQMVLESESVHPGSKALLLLSLAEPDGYVVLSRQSGHTGHEMQLIRVEGTAKLVELDITQKDLPNLHLSAALVSRGNLHQDNQEIVVHPEERFLRLEVAPDRDDYQPREKGRVDLRVLDHVGNPVKAELAVSVADESVFAIQQSLNPDPRRTFYRRRNAWLRFSSSFGIHSYRRLVMNGFNQLVDQYSNLPINGRIGGVVGGVPGGIASNAVVYSRLARRSGFSVRNAPSSMLAMRDASPPPAPPAFVRSDFRSTLLWRPGLVSDEQGRVSVPVQFADKLTDWRTTVQALTADSRFGSAQASMRTSQPLIVRLQAPRFFVQGDEVTVSTVIHNHSERPEAVQPMLHWSGVRFKELSAPSGAVHIPAGGEHRADWRFKVLEAGQARFKAEARGGQLADAVEQTYPVYEHGLERLITRSGKVGVDESLIDIQLPRERRPGSTRLQVSLTPSLAAAMLDALPYLIDYPYGCTEQTMSRFLPAVAVTKTLRDQGVAPEILERRLFGGPSTQATKKGSKMGRLDDVIEQGLKRLYSFQQGDGGWGWWKEGQTDLYMTSYVLWGFSLARLAGVEVDPGAMGRAFRFLDQSLAEASHDPDLQAWILQALTAAGKADRSLAASALQRRALDNLWQHRQSLSAAGRALITLSAHRLGQSGWVSLLLRNLENGVRRDNSSASSLTSRDASSQDAQSTQTVHWGSTQSSRRWWESAVESTALHLQALIEIEPSHPLVEPAIQWLVQNRRGNQWSNTRDTALAVLALNEYLKATGELVSGAGFEVLVNDQSVASGSLTSLEEALARPVRIEVEPSLLQDGRNRIKIRRTFARGSLYFAAEARFFSLEEPIPSGGNQVFVQRDYYRLVPRQTLLKGTVFERHRLRLGEALQSGDRVEVILTLEAKNDLTYLMLEDLKPAGLESVEVQSGAGPPARRLSRQALQERQESGMVKPPSQDWGIRRYVYRELRDRKVALFIDRLDQGFWEIRYQMRAEVPGRFHALPLVAEAMYAPDIRANSREQSLEVSDR